MNTEFFIAKKIISGNKKQSGSSKPIVKLAILGIALGLIVMILTVAIVKGFQDEIRDKVIGFGSNIQITGFSTNNSFEPEPINKNQPFYSNLSKLNGIKHIQVYATKNGIIKTKDEIEGVVLKGVDKDYNWDFIKKNITEGNILTHNDTAASKEIIISGIIAKRLNLKINDKLFIYFITKKKNEDNSNSPTSYEQRVKNFTICGIYDTGFEEFDKKTVYVDIQQIQKLNYWPEDIVSGFEIEIENLDKIEEMGEVVNNEVGHEFNAQTIKQLNATIFSWLDLQDMNAIIVIILMIVVSAINMISTLLIIILERTNMIGILKSLGMNDLSIQKIFLYNAAYIIGKGLVWGNAIGILLCYIQLQFGVFTLPKETYYVSVVPIKIDVIQVVILNSITLISCLVMLILPSFVVSKITPVKAIRFS